jgi:hypothetical protein
VRLLGAAVSTVNPLRRAWGALDALRRSRGNAGRLNGGGKPGSRLASSIEQRVVTGHNGSMDGTMR